MGLHASHTTLKGTLTPGLGRGATKDRLCPPLPQKDVDLGQWLFLVFPSAQLSNAASVLPSSPGRRRDEGMTKEESLLSPHSAAELLHEPSLC